MGLLQGKRVLLGVTGSIAAYKSTYIVREFIKAGAEVRVILTPAAREFVTPLSLATLSKNPVLDSLIKDAESGEWNNHVALGLWADLFLIAPATAHTLSKMASATADNLLLTTYLSARCPVFFAPAMDLDMHAHGANQENIKKLESLGNIHIPSGSGELASGLEGTGRMAEPADIVNLIEAYFNHRAPLRGKKVLITAGPTREPIDPVRYIGNRSTGKMGYAIAERALAMGAEVILVTGPVALDAPKGAKVISVETAAEMYAAADAHFEDVDIAVMSAAVADFKPTDFKDKKIKKSGAERMIYLEETVDILKTLGAKKANQLLVGFALETDNEEANAKSKLERKNCDMIVLNSLRDAGAGFGHDTNKVKLIMRNKSIEIELKSKAAVASDIWSTLIKEFL